MNRNFTKGINKVNAFLFLFFFTAQPFINTCAEVLLRIRIPNHVQGRAWGISSIPTQSGYVLAYAVSGLLSDYVFTPMLMENGLLAGSS